MQGLKRRVVYITLYEGIAIVAASAGLALMTGQGAGHSGVAGGDRLGHRDRSGT